MTGKKNILAFERPIVELEKKIEEIRKLATDQVTTGNVNGAEDLNSQIDKFEQKLVVLQKSIYENITRWERIQIARHPDRPCTLDYIELMTENFLELRGDRLYADDKAIVGGFARLSNSKGFYETVMIIGHQKGKDTKSNIYRNFGMAEPEGYRKAVRLMKLAEKFGKPVITLIDTPGASPGLGAEERGQAEAIAKSMYEMSCLRVPIICIIIGEGASGGAIGIGVGDKILMLENSWYSVISPESCSSILWRNWDHKATAAEALKLSAIDLIKNKVIDEVIPEPLGGAHVNPKIIASTLKKSIIKNLIGLQKYSTEKLVDRRVSKFGAMGEFELI
ncbi:hypothetical protein CHS0354_023998 [Potamilus streckersoni]|uniref:acetyl-CoA carboxytransferase n=1 Tax=Potamilus streckersoni TaxID=2493646 RepID=A0AAE0VMM9_9BIVA|nr:hypothetical protein CHS0354_023998 [Potamilus streckersoni]